MSALDKAFIKAYTKGANPPGRAAESAPHHPPLAAYGPYADPQPGSPYAALEAMYGAGLMYRVDAPHREGGLSAGSGLHMPVGPAAGPAGLAYVGPYYDPGLYGPAPQFHTRSAT